MLKIENIALSYSSIKVIQDVSLKVEKGEIVALVGVTAVGNQPS